METKEYYGGTYPEAPEIEEKHIEAKIYLTFTIEEDIPANWDKEKIIEDIKENLNDFDWLDEKIEEIEL